jgi:hypothetical protein
MTARDIRMRYPHPQSGLTPAPLRYPHLDDNYCVGGALCKYLGSEEGWQGANFPMVSALCDVLQEANAHLTYAGALRRSAAITRVNDAGNFEKAWHLLDLALKAKH